MSATRIKRRSRSGARLKNSARLLKVRSISVATGRNSSAWTLTAPVGRPLAAETVENAITRSGNSLSVAILRKNRPHSSRLPRFFHKSARAAPVCVGFVPNRDGTVLFALVLSQTGPDKACGPRFGSKSGRTAPVCLGFAPDRGGQGLWVSISSQIRTDNSRLSRLGPTP